MFGKLSVENRAKLQQDKKLSTQLLSMMELQQDQDIEDCLAE